jgi:hypothetical protein
MCGFLFRKGAALLAAALLFAACDSATNIESGIEGNALSLNQAQTNVRTVNYDFPDPFVFDTFQDVFNAIAAYAYDTDFTITLLENIVSEPINITDAGFAGKTISIFNYAAPTSITLDGIGQLFTLEQTGSPVTLIIKESVSLIGVPNNTGPLVDVRNNSIFKLTDSAVITGNTNIYGGGGGVRVRYGEFNMDGNSEIYKNSTHTTSSNSYGGGVYVTNGRSIFNLSGNASIHDNTCIGSVNVGGGGVALDYGTAFNMSGGSIIDNTVMDDSSPGARVFGGGVYVFTHASTFTMTGGVIARNKVIHSAEVKNFNAGGGGVCIDTGFWGDEVTLDKTPRGGTIYGFDILDPDSNYVMIGDCIATSGYGNTAQVVTTDPSSGRTVSVDADKETTVASTDTLFAQYHNAANSWTLTGW